MYRLKQTKLSIDKKFFILIFSFFLIIFVFTNDGHRFTFDEDVATQQSKRIATMSPDPSYVQGQSRLLFEYPWLFPPEHNMRPICQNAILCSMGNIVHSLTQVPLILLNHNFHFIPTSNLWSVEDFDDFHYVSWRNDVDPDFTFMELFYGPIFSALSTGVFFLLARSFGFAIKTSIIITVLLGLSTFLWAYSQTSLNAVPFTFFILLGLLLYKKYQMCGSYRFLTMCGISFGLAFLTRNDAILFIIPIFVFLLIGIAKKNYRVKSFFSFVIPVSMSYVIYKILEFVRFGPRTDPDTALVAPAQIANAAFSNPYFLQIFGILFSPGAGIFVYNPVLLLSFIGFYDFYKKNKSDCLLIIILSLIMILIFSSSNYWHGFNGWGPRYLVPILPLLLLPIAASIEKRKSLFFKISLISLGVIGFLINIVYLLQDVSWFVWGFLGSDERGLYSLARKADGNVYDLWINPIIIWSPEYNQLTQSIFWLISKPQIDLFLLKIFGSSLYLLSFFSLLFVPLFFIIKFIKKYQ